MSLPARGAGMCAVVAACVPLVAGCAPGTVTVNAPISDPETVAACAELIDALPETLAGQERRDIRPVDAPAAAWGDPEIVLTCGGSIPEEYDFAPCVEADGVGWYIPEEAGPGAPYRIATVGQEPTVVVEMPSWPPAEAMLDLAAAVGEHTRLVTPCE